MDKTPADVIDLCSDGDDDEGDNAAADRSSSIADHDEDAVVHHRASRHTLKDDSTTNAVSNKRQRVSPIQEVILLVQDEQIETTDVTLALSQVAHNGNAATLITLFSSCTTSRSTLYHIRQQDQWSCGFRNLQMILVNLLSILSDDHHYFRERPKQDGGIVEIPTLLEIQHLLEQAWQSGWDANGASHYRGKLAHKKVWIGAVEVTSALGFLTVDATIIQFMECRESRMMLGPFCKAYFENRAGCCQCRGQSSRQCAMETLHLAAQQDGRRTKGDHTCSCPLLPLYLQWEGHSVTIVGVELNVEMQLLVLDPMKCGRNITKTLYQGRIAPIRKSIASLSKRNSQIVLCSAKNMSLQDRGCMKRTANCITAAENAVAQSLRARDAA